MTLIKNEKVVPLREEPQEPPPFQFGRSYEADVSAITFTSRQVKTKANTAVVSGVDLSDKPKVILLAGRGKTGKTTAIRWMSERALTAGRPLLMGDVDPGNIGFGTYFKGVHEPPDRDNPEIAFRWLEEFIAHAIEHWQTAVIDLGGGDTTLRRLADELPDLAKHADANGVAIVVLYFIGPQIDDLSPIASMAQREFRPHATAIIMNEASVQVGMTREQAFAPVSQYPLLRDVFERGAVPVWMPKLLPWEAIELKRAHFIPARDGATAKDGRPILGPFDRSRVRAWLDAMETQWSGIQTWLP